MAFSKTNRTIEQLGNVEVNGFADINGTTIRESADLIMTPADAENTQQNAKNISNTFGNIIAWLLNAASEDPNIAGVNIGQLRIMYLMLAAAPYKGYKVEYKLHTFDPSNPIDNKCISDLKRLKVDEADTGMEKKYGSILQLVVDGRVIGMYYPKWRLFIPGVGFTELCIDGMDFNEFMDANPHVTHRCRAIFTNMLDHGANPNVIHKVLNSIGGRLSDDEMKKYRAELVATIAGDVNKYILATSPDADPAAVCGYLGTNNTDKLLDAPVLINTGDALMGKINRSFKNVSDRLVIIPPVQNATRIYDAAYAWGSLNKYGIPAWIEFSAEIDGVLHHRIYAGEFKTCRPDNFIDMAYNVPKGILAKYNYLIQESSAGSLGIDDLQTCWKVYPDDETSTEITLKSLQYPDEEWKICQRSSRIECMELCDSITGDVLGTVIPEKAPDFSCAMQTMYLSLDPAGTVSVRLKAIAGAVASKGLEYTDLIYPITPMAEDEFEQIIERHMISSDSSGTHFDSLLQRFFPQGSSEWSMLMVESRIWKPDEKALFEALKTYPGVMTDAMLNLGVISNMKELLTHPNLGTININKEDIVKAFKSYIGTMLLEAILALSREGYAFKHKNLVLLISFPENGSGEGFTKLMKEIIRGALGYVNEYLDVNNQIEETVNAKMYSESEATAVWHQNNLPDENFIGNGVAAGTPDYGYSTHDFSLSINGLLILFSIPYAAMRITNATLAKVYANKVEELMRCFKGGSSELRKQAQEALEEAMQSDCGKLYERLGFILSLNRLFSICTFKVTGVNTDVYQRRVQEITEARLNVAIPAYANAIVRALKAGVLKINQRVLIAPVGKGSLAITNTAPGFKMRFIRRLCDEINYQIKLDGSFPEGTEYTGVIDLLPNNDKDKMSVAQGMIDIQRPNYNRASIDQVVDPTEHYLDLAYGAGEMEDLDAKEYFRSELAELDRPGKKLDYNKLKTKLYEDAFSKLIENYTYEDFEKAFERFGYTNINQGIPAEEMGVLDKAIRNTVKDQFENLCAQLKQQGEDLIMSCPFIEEEMICGALIDLAIDRMDLFEDKKQEARECDG